MTSANPAEARVIHAPDFLLFRPLSSSLCGTAAALQSNQTMKCYVLARDSIAVTVDRTLAIYRRQLRITSIASPDPANPSYSFPMISFEYVKVYQQILSSHIDFLSSSENIIAVLSSSEGGSHVTLFLSKGEQSQSAGVTCVTFTHVDLSFTAASASPHVGRSPTLKVNIHSISCGERHVLALNEERNRVYSCGCGDKGQLGYGKIVLGSSNSFSEVIFKDSHPSLSEKRLILSVSAGVDVSFVCCSDSIYSFGSNDDYSRLGLGPQTNEGLMNVLSPTSIEYFEMVNFAAQLECSDRRTIPSYQDKLDVREDVGSIISKFRGAFRVSCGRWHCVALCGNGDVYGWGWSKFGQLGNNVLVQQDGGGGQMSGGSGACINDGKKANEGDDEEDDDELIDVDMYHSPVILNNRLSRAMMHASIGSEAFSSASDCVTQVNCGEKYTLFNISSSKYIVFGQLESPVYSNNSRMKQVEVAEAGDVKVLDAAVHLDILAHRNDFDLSIETLAGIQLFRLSELSLQIKYPVNSEFKHRGLQNGYFISFHAKTSDSLHDDNDTKQASRLLALDSHCGTSNVSFLIES